MSALWFGVGLAAVLSLTEYVHFVWTPTPGLHSWVTEHHYPIQQQVFWFYATIVGVPCSVAVGHVVRVATERMLTTRGAPMQISERASLLCMLPLLGVWVPLLRLQPAGCVLALLAGSLVSMVALGVVAGAWRSLAPVPLEDVPEPELPASDPPARRPSCLVHRLSLLLVLVALPLDLYLALFDPRISGGVDLFHEGEQLVPLLEILHGGVPYRDVYLQHGFMENLGIPWLGAKLFAPTLAGVRWMQALVDPLGEVGAYALMVGLTGARLLPALLIAVLLVASPVDVSSRAFFGLCSLAVLAWPLQAGRRQPATSPRGTLTARVRFFCSGVLAMAALLYSTEVGLYTLATGILFLSLTGATDNTSSWSSRAKPVGGFVGGAVLAWIPFAAALAAHGALDDFLVNLLDQTRYQLELWGKPFPGLSQTIGPLLSGDFTSESLLRADNRVWWYACPALLTMSGGWLAHCGIRGRFRASRFALPLLLLSLAAAFYFRSLLGRADPSHANYAVLFSLLMLVFFADALWCQGRALLFEGRGSPARRRGAGLCLLLAAATVAMLPLACVDRAAESGLGVAHACQSLIPANKRMSFNAALSAEKIVPAAQLQRLNELETFLAAETTPEETVLDFTNQAAQLFFAHRRSVTRYFQVVYAALPEMQQEIIDRMEAEQTRFVLMREEGFEARFGGVRYRERHPILAEYVASHFSPFRAIGELRIWKRNGLASPAVAH